MSDEPRDLVPIEPEEWVESFEDDDDPNLTVLRPEPESPDEGSLPSKYRRLLDVERDVEVTLYQAPDGKGVEWAIKIVPHEQLHRVWEPMQ